MLRRWSQRGLASATPAARRTFWNPLDILSRLKSGDEDTDKKVATADAQDQAHCRANSEWRSQADVEFPTFLGDARAGRVAHAKKVFSVLAQHLRNATDPVQLMESWNVIRQCCLRPADEGNGAAENKTSAVDVLQMLPADEFAQRIAGITCRTMFVGSTPLERNVIAANEAVVVALLVGNFYALDDHERTIKFFGGYSRDRLNWLKERSAVETGAGGPPGFSPSLSGFVRATRLWAPARSAYLDLLLAKNDYHKIAQFAREDTRNLESACESVMTMTPLLIGCRKEKDSALARLAIEMMAEKNPISKKNRNESDLDNALCVMQDDAGYVLHPDLWLALFNTRLHLNRKDSALSFEIFGLYSKSFTALYQDQFRRALRKAC
ncbi:hypothetical protein GQ600_21655 [Phytophthora cactorum]|nr:hypothetical protein GQ600_21655 [Phytophthora cactorum]